jgi:hypothetical protein
MLVLQVADARAECLSNPGLGSGSHGAVVVAVGAAQAGERDRRRRRGHGPAPLQAGARERYASSPGQRPATPQQRPKPHDGRKIHVGDIDVLVLARTSRRLWLLECKDLSRAATPWSIKHQIEDLFEDRPSEKSIQTKHEARVTWARDRVAGLVQLVGETGDGWEVRGAIVTAVELVAPLLASARMPVIAWHRLVDFDL